MKSIFLRYFIMLALVILLSFMSLGVFFLIASASVLTNQRFENLNSIADELLSAADTYSGDSLLPSAVNSIAMIGKAMDIHILITDETGEVVLCSENSDTHIGGMLDPELFNNLSQADITTVQKLELSGSLQNVISRRILTDDVFSGVILLNSSAQPESELLGAFVRMFFIVSMIVMLVAFCFAYATSRTMARPLRDMARCAHDFAHGNFTIRVNRWIERDDEIGELACAFNAMADALDKSEMLRRGFIANVSHELKTPMTIISGYIGGLLDGTIPNDKQDETLQIVREDVWRLSRMVSSMSELSHLQSGKITINTKVFDICELCMRVLVGLESRINEKQLDVQINLPNEEFLNVTADADLLVQVMTNLIDNAIKFSNIGGTIELSIIRRSPKAQIAVKNTGDTIPPEELPYIFDRYHKTDRSRSVDRTGLGLGLYLVQSIINNHKENIHVRSENNVTEFTFTLLEAKK